MRDVRGGAWLAEKAPEDERIWNHMDAGDAIRDQSGRNDAVAGLAIGLIFDNRKESHGGGPASSTAFVLDSLKHPEEIATLRRIYGSRFILIAVHSPTGARLQALMKRIAVSHGAPERADDFRESAQRLMERDEHDEQKEFGQRVRAAFTKGDVYVSTSPEHELLEGIIRYLRLFFGDPFLTPTRDEYLMFQAHAAALRSADLSRQVGAAISGPQGDIIAIGCNEVPKAFGGQYWADDDPDDRDFQLGYDSNLKYRDDAFSRALERLQQRGYITGSIELGDFILALRGTRLADVTEFGRPVHAEMAALLDAARRGAAIRGHRLFTTTFPCHNCARHIIAAGIKEVIYREPYEKSLAAKLHEDAISVDPTSSVADRVVFRRFVGVGPPRYFDLFSMVPRKDRTTGNKLVWSEEKATPRLISTEVAYLADEEDFIDEFRDAIAKVDLSKEEKGGNGNSNGLAKAKS